MLSNLFLKFFLRYTDLEACRLKLSQVQEYHRTGRELENTIRQG